MRKYIDTLILVENEKILSIAEEGVSATEAFNMANDVLYRAAKGIADIITRHGHVNVDFADVRSIMAGAGDAVMGSAAAAGERRALKASSDALNSPLLEGVSVKGAKGVLVNITGEVTMRDMSDAMNYIEEQVGSDAKIINGYVDEPQVSGEIRVTVIVTGFKRKSQDDGTVPAVRQFVAPVPGIRLGQVPSSVRQTASLHPERQEEDLRIPAYIRRQLSINDPHEVAGRKNTGHDADYNSSLPGGRVEHEDKIQKGLSDTPAYLRRKKNGI